MAEPPSTYDILVAGAGPVGLSTGLACALRGLSVCVVGAIERPQAGRTVALLDGSLRILEAIGLGPAVEAVSAPMRLMRLVDSTDSLFRSNPVEFDCRELGLEAFGRNVETGRLIELLRNLAERTPGLAFMEGLLEGHELGEDLVQARCGDIELSARLLVGADGARSPVRRAAGIEARTWTYGQAALTAVFAHRRPHGDASTEIHSREGPFTLVPLPAAPGDPHRSSLVWMTDARLAERLRALAPEAFAEAAERRCQRLLGPMELRGDIGFAPMRGLAARRLTGRRTALAGEAAHVFPPLGAQGLNLGLRDAAGLAAALETRADPGSPHALADYARRRRLDIALRGAAVDLFDRSLASRAADPLRGLGFVALQTSAPLRRAVMRLGLGPRMKAPRV